MKEETRIKHYLLEKLGERGKNRKGLMRVIRDYQSWMDPEENTVDAVLAYAKRHGHDVKSRKGYIVDNRYYLYVYLFCELNVRLSDIARMFNVSHCTVLHALTDFEHRAVDPKFLDRTIASRKRFPYNLYKAVAVIEIKRGYGKLEGVETTDLDNESLHLYLIKSLIEKDSLKGSVLKDRQASKWKRYFLFYELKKHNWSNAHIAETFGISRRETVREGIIAMKDDVSRRLNRTYIRGYMSKFDNLDPIMLQ